MFFQKIFTSDFPGLTLSMVPPPAKFFLTWRSSPDFPHGASLALHSAALRACIANDGPRWSYTLKPDGGELRGPRSPRGPQRDFLERFVNQARGITATIRAGKRLLRLRSKRLPR